MNWTAGDHEHCFWLMALFCFGLVQRTHTDTNTNLFHYLQIERSKHALTLQPTLSLLSFHCLNFLAVLDCWWPKSAVSVLRHCHLFAHFAIIQEFSFLFVSLSLLQLFSLFFEQTTQTKADTYTHAAIVVKFSKLANLFLFSSFLVWSFSFYFTLSLYPNFTYRIYFCFHIYFYFFCSASELTHSVFHLLLQQQKCSNSLNSKLLTCLWFHYKSLPHPLHLIKMFIFIKPFFWV